MDFSFSDEQIAIRELAYKIFTDRATDEFLLEFSRNSDSYDEELWQTLAEQGLLGITVPEAAGGIGLGFIELCLVLEEQGKRVAPVPLLANLVLGGLPIAKFGSEEQQQKYLTPLAEGTSKLSAAVSEIGMSEAIAQRVNASQSGTTWTLNGRKECIIDGAIANHVLVPAIDEAGNCSFFIIDTAAQGVSVEPQEIGLLGEWSANIEMKDVVVEQDAILGEIGEGSAIIDYIEQHTNVAQCAMQTGVCEETMKRTAAYTSERKQFGVPIGSFQALAMRMADSYIDVEAIRSSYWLAMWRLSEELSAAAEVRSAKWWACDASHRIIHTAQHLHAGLGSDIEYPIHRFFLWAKQISYSMGSGSHQLEQLGKLLAEDDSVGYSAIEV